MFFLSCVWRAGVFIAGAGSLWTVGYADNPCKLGGEVNEVDETAMPCTYSRWRSSYLASSDPHKILFGGPSLVQVMMNYIKDACRIHESVSLYCSVQPHGGARRMEGAARRSKEDGRCGTIFFISKKNVHYSWGLPASLMESLSSFLLFLKIFLREGKPHSRK